eukprot:SAG31_NODE_689_length_12806_cov_5.358857_16_plen_102_part_00
MDAARAPHLQALDLFQHQRRLFVQPRVRLATRFHQRCGSPQDVESGANVKVPSLQTRAVWPGYLDSEGLRGVVCRGKSPTRLGCTCTAKLKLRGWCAPMWT